MNIFTRLYQSLSKGIQQPFYQLLGSRYGVGVQSRVQLKGLEEYKNWVNACVKVRANAVANIDLDLYDKDGVEVESNPILDLLDRVNPYMTKKDLLKATQSFLDLNGNAFWYLARDKDGKGEIKEIYILRPDKVSLVIDSANPLLVGGYVFKQDGGRKIALDANEVIHFKNFNPMGEHPFPHMGMSVVEASAWAIDTDNEIRKWNLNFFKNSATPNGILEVGKDGAVGTEEYKRLREQWDKEHKGSAQAHKVAILSGGVTWKETSTNQSEMQFADQKVLNRDEILAIFQVPKTILGLTDNVNRATADASIYVFNLFTVKELMQNIVDTLNEFLLPDFDEQGTLYFDFDSPVKEDRTEVLAEYTAGINNWLTRNEIRAREGLPPTAEGDVIMGGINLVEIDNLPVPKKAKSEKLKVKAIAKKDTKTLSIAEKAIEDFVGKMPTRKVYKHIEGDVRDNYIKLWKANLNSSRAQLKKKLEAYFTKQEAEVLRNLRNELKGLETKEFKYKAVSDIVFDEEEAIKAGVSLMTPYLQDYLNRSADQASNLAGGEAFDINSSPAQNFIKARAKLFAEQITETTATSIVDTVQAGLDEGLTIDEISANISNVYDIAKGSRADMIARTEASASANEGAKLAYQDAGVGQWEWIVVDPEDNDCKQNEGKVVDIGDTFPDGSVQPPDPHPNCECGTLPVFDNSN
jgi:HK97 family phage portal protein